jgi:ferrous iron transport protein A
MCIKDLKVGEQKTIVSFNRQDIGGKLLSMGIKPGCKVTLLRKTNFDKAFYLKIDASRMAIRSEEAAMIELM